ncbi:MAG: hypothetical protein HYY96_15835 [Candidatus Tectomicrobia bacterium]|nr:hypothetical protein [Candidatus Tectomicrobia bacterium]
MKKRKPREAAPPVDIHEFLHVVEKDGRRLVACACGHEICPAQENFKRHLLVSDWQMSRISPLAEQIAVPEKFVFREFYCPGCYLLLETEVALKDEAIRWDVKLGGAPA